MTTFEPGASEVFTQGLTSRPFSTAAFASRPAASITYGFDVFVHDVMAAMTTWPWSRSKDAPSAVVTGTLATGRDDDSGVDSVDAVGSGSPVPATLSAGATGSDAGNDCADAASTAWASDGSDSVSAARNIGFDSVSGTRSCGRFGPASDGVTVAEVELEGLGEHGLGRRLVVPQPLLLGVRLDERQQLRRTPARTRGSAASRRRSGRS